MSPSIKSCNPSSRQLFDTMQRMYRHGIDQDGSKCIRKERDNAVRDDHT